MVSRLFYPRRNISAGMDDANADDVHQRIPVIAAVKSEIPPDHGDTDAIPISPNPLYDMFKKIPVLFPVKRPEIERIHQGNRTCAHREYIPNNSPNPCRRSIMGIDIARVVVALHGDRERDPV